MKTPEPINFGYTHQPRPRDHAEDDRMGLNDPAAPTRTIRGHTAQELANEAARMGWTGTLYVPTHTPTGSRALPMATKTAAILYNFAQSIPSDWRVDLVRFDDPTPVGGEFEVRATG